MLYCKCNGHLFTPVQRDLIKQTSCRPTIHGRQLQFHLCSLIFNKRTKIVRISTLKRAIRKVCSANDLQSKRVTFQLPTIAYGDHSISKVLFLGSDFLLFWSKFTLILKSTYKTLYEASINHLNLSALIFIVKIVNYRKSCEYLSMVLNHKNKLQHSPNHERNRRA